ncbi:tyrosine-type recombinase/integrase, partial [Schinkia azotoformans]
IQVMYNFDKVKNVKINESRIKMINEFLKELEKQDLSERTIMAYLYDVTQFLNWTKEKDSSETKITKEILRDYLINLLITQSMSTSARKIKSIIRYNNFLYQMGKTDERIEPKETLYYVNQKKESRIKIVKDADLEEFRKVIFECGNKRDILIFSLLLGTACRNSELINIKMDDISIKNSKEGYLLINNTKTAKKSYKRKIVLTEFLIKSIEDYLKVRPIHESNILLIGQKGPLSRIAINKLMEKYSRLANIGFNITPHMLRHYSILNMITIANKEGTDLSIITKIAGHSTPYYTETVYLNTIRTYRNINNDDTKYINLGGKNDED